MIKEIIESNLPNYATLSSATITLNDMGDRTISTQMKILGSIVPSFSYNGEAWAVTYNGEKFILTVRDPEASKSIDSSSSTISLNFESEFCYELKRYLFFEAASTYAGTIVADKYKASLKLSISDFVTNFNQVLSYYFGAGVFSIRLAQGVSFSSTPALFDIDHIYIWDVLQKIYEIYNVRWGMSFSVVGGVTQYVITIGEAISALDHVFEYGYAGGLTKCERQIQESNIRNILLGRGGDKNLPRYYFKDVPEGSPYTPDPDHCPELDNENAPINITQLHGKTFRDYIQGWNYGKNYGNARPEPLNPSDAWSQGYADATTGANFNPVEYVKDQDSIDKYGELWSGLDDNEDIYPSIQGVKMPSPDYSDANAVVAVEQVTNDDIEEAVAKSVVITDLPAAAQAICTGTWRRKEPAIPPAYMYCEVWSREFTVPEGQTANITYDTAIYVSDLVTWNHKGLTGVKEMDKGIHTYYNPIIHTSTDAVNPSYFILQHAGTGYYYSDEEGYPIHNPSAIPAGSYRLIVHVGFTPTFPDGEMPHITFTSEISNIQITSAAISVWKPSFDIWIKNIWGTTKGQSESYSAYTSRVWNPILGDLSEGTKQISFVDGALSSSSDWDFKILGVEYNTDDTKIYEDASHNTHKAEWKLTLEKSQAEKETDNKFIPRENTNASAGDHIMVLGIQLPQVLVEAAEERLDLWKTEQLNSTKDIEPTWAITLDKVRINTLEGDETVLLSSLIDAGVKIQLRDIRFSSGIKELYIQSLEKTWNDETVMNPEINVVLTDKVIPVSNPVSKIKAEVKTIQSQYVAIQDVEAAVRRVGSLQFLNKTGSEDTSMSPTKFSNVVQSSDFRQGDIGGMGWGFYKDKQGNSIFEADTIIARNNLITNEIISNIATYVGGLQIYSAASIVCTNIVEDVSGYSCYFDNKLGSLANLFQVRDIAYSHTFDSSNSTISFYKREVIEVGLDYVKLSKTSFAEGSSAPAIGDTIIHYGNFNDSNRQFVIVRDVVNGGYERMISNLNGYNAGAEYYYAGAVLSGSEVQKRWFVGDTSNYAKYEKVGDSYALTIKGNVFVGDTDISSWAYLAESLGSKNGGLVLANKLAVYNGTDAQATVQGGINGVYIDSNSIAAWFGGDMKDRAMSQDLDAASILFRFGGSGYVAKNNLSWDENGVVTLNPDQIYVSSGLKMSEVNQIASIIGLKPVDNISTAFIKEGRPFLVENNITATGIVRGDAGVFSGGISDLGYDSPIIDLYTDWSDNAPINKALGAALGVELHNNKVDKVAGYALSKNDLTDALLLDLNANTAYRHSHTNKAILDNITITDVNNWNGAYSWGNHASAGYLLASFAEDTYIPYVGANKDVDLGNKSISLYNLYALNNISAEGGVAAGGISDLGYDSPVIDLYTDWSDNAPTNKALSAELGIELHNTKVDKVTGYGLSKNDLSDALLLKLNGIDAGANLYVHPTSGIAAGTYKSVTVDANGHVTAGSNPTTLAGYGITDAASASALATLDANHDACIGALAGQVLSLQAKNQFDEIYSEYAHIKTLSSDLLVGYLKGNADTASELLTERFIWGQKFKGDANVSGNMTGVGSVESNGNIHTTQRIYGDAGVFSGGIGDLGEYGSSGFNDIEYIGSGNIVTNVDKNVSSLKVFKSFSVYSDTEIDTIISTEVTNRNTAITDAINLLNVEPVGGTGKYISAISEANGKISATESDMPTLLSQFTDDLGSSPVHTHSQYMLASARGEVDGVAPLDINSKIPAAYLYDYFFGQVLYGGGLGANALATLTSLCKSKLGTTSSTITLTNNNNAITGYVANEGIYYIITSAQTFAGISFEVGDWCISNGSAWTKVDNTDAVASVAGLTGAISKASLLSALNVADGAQVNKIESVKLNGTALTITSKAVNVNACTSISVPTGLSVAALDSDGLITISLATGYAIPMTANITQIETNISNHDVCIGALAGQVLSLQAKNQFDEIYSEYAHIKTLSSDLLIGYLKGNADTATKLATARTLWGQSFDGTAEIKDKMLQYCTGLGYSTTRQIELSSGLVKVKDTLNAASASFSGNVTDAAIHYFANGTTYYVNASGAAKFNGTNTGALTATTGEFTGKVHTTNQVVGDAGVFSGGIGDLGYITPIIDLYTDWSDNAPVNKALSAELGIELHNNKVDKVTGYSLSKNDLSDALLLDLNANTSARHSHSNKTLLDTYTQEEANLASAVSQKHSHTNKTVLDNTTASFLTADKTKLAGIAAGANNYSLPTASSTVLGGIKVGSRLTISSGVLSADVQSDNNFTSTYKNKLEGIATGANLYVHPTYTARTSGLYKVTVDASGHVSAVAAVAKPDITALGIPAQDTVYVHPASGVSAGTYKSVTVDANGHVTAGSNPTTLAGYGITDAKIVSGVITLGANTITPLVTHQTIYGLTIKKNGNQVGSVYNPNSASAIINITDVASASALGIVQGYFSNGSAKTALKLTTAVTINGTDFDGSAAITTSKWGTARNVGILNSDGTGTAVTVSVDGSGNVNLKLPASIKASLEGNAATANKVNHILTRGAYLTGNNFDGSADTTWSVDATSANIAGKVVARDINGDFAARVISGQRIYGDGGVFSGGIGDLGEFGGSGYNDILPYPNETGNAVTSISDNGGSTLYYHLGSFSLSDHNHNSVYSVLGHTHDDRYYTETEIGNILGSYALQSALTAHANLSTTAHGLGASAFHADSYFALAGHNHSGVYQPLDADLTAIAGLAGTSGFLKKTAANTWALDTNTYLTGITKAQVEAVLTGAITSHTHNYQAPLTGTGFVKSAAGVISYDTNTYLTTHQAIYALTIQKNGDTIATYTPNSAAKTINISDVASATSLDTLTTNTDQCIGALAGQIISLQLKNQFDELYAEYAHIKTLSSDLLIGALKGNADTTTAFQSAQSIALTGDISGSASSTAGWSIITTIGAGRVTNAMLAGSIDNSKLSNSAITLAGRPVSLGGSITKAEMQSDLSIVTLDTPQTITGLKTFSNAVVFNEHLILANAKTFYGRNTTGDNIHLLGINSNNEIALGYGARVRGYRTVLQGHVIQAVVGSGVSAFDISALGDISMYKSVSIADNLNVGGIIQGVGGVFAGGIADLQEDSWTTPTLTNGTHGITYGAVRYRKVGSNVQIDGSFTITWDGSSQLQLFNLPSGYNPSHNMTGWLYNNSNGIWRYVVGTDGWVSLINIKSITDGSNITASTNCIFNSFTIPLN